MEAPTHAFSAGARRPRSLSRPGKLGSDLRDACSPFRSPSASSRGLPRPKTAGKPSASRSRRQQKQQRQRRQAARARACPAAAPMSDSQQQQQEGALPSLTDSQVRQLLSMLAPALCKGCRSNLCCGGRAAGGAPPPAPARAGVAKKQQQKKTKKHGRRGAGAASRRAAAAAWSPTVLDAPPAPLVTTSAICARVAAEAADAEAHARALASYGGGIYHSPAACAFAAAALAGAPLSPDRNNSHGAGAPAWAGGFVLAPAGAGAADEPGWEDPQLAALDAQWRQQQQQQFAASSSTTTTTTTDTPGAA